MHLLGMGGVSMSHDTNIAHNRDVECRQCMASSVLQKASSPKSSPSKQARSTKLLICGLSCWRRVRTLSYCTV